MKNLILILIVITFYGCASKKSKTREQERLKGEYEYQNKSTETTKTTTDIAETTKTTEKDSTGSETEIITEFKEVTQPDGVITSVPIKKTEKRKERGLKSIKKDEVRDKTEKKDEKLIKAETGSGKTDTVKTVEVKNKKTFNATTVIIAGLAFIITGLLLIWYFRKPKNS